MSCHSKNYLNSLALNSAKRKLIWEKTFKRKDRTNSSWFNDNVLQFRGKLIGILEVPKSRGDHMCQEAIGELKMAIKAAGEHKLRIAIIISLDGLKLKDEKTGFFLYHHAVHKISFIAQDLTDSRAFGYVYGSPDEGHKFFGIKTEKSAYQVVLALRNLFQFVFEMKLDTDKNIVNEINKSFVSPLGNHTKEGLLNHSNFCEDLLGLQCDTDKNLKSTSKWLEGSKHFSNLQTKINTQNIFCDSFNPDVLIPLLEPPPSNAKLFQNQEKHKNHVNNDKNELEKTIDVFNCPKDILSKPDKLLKDKYAPLAEIAASQKCIFNSHFDTFIPLVSKCSAEQSLGYVNDKVEPSIVDTIVNKSNEFVEFADFSIFTEEEKKSEVNVDTLQTNQFSSSSNEKNYSSCDPCIKGLKCINLNQIEIINKGLSEIQVSDKSVNNENYSEKKGIDNQDKILQDNVGNLQLGPRSSSFNIPSNLPPKKQIIQKYNLCQDKKSQLDTIMVYIEQEELKVPTLPTPWKNNKQNSKKANRTKEMDTDFKIKELFSSKVLNSENKLQLENKSYPSGNTSSLLRSNFVLLEKSTENLSFSGFNNEILIPEETLLFKQDSKNFELRNFGNEKISIVKYSNAHITDSCTVINEKSLDCENIEENLPKVINSMERKSPVSSNTSDSNIYSLATDFNVQKKTFSEWSSESEESIQFFPLSKLKKDSNLIHQKFKNFMTCNHINLWPQPCCNQMHAKCFSDANSYFSQSVDSCSSCHFSHLKSCYSPPRIFQHYYCCQCDYWIPKHDCHYLKKFPTNDNMINFQFDDNFLQDKCNHDPWKPIHCKQLQDNDICFSSQNDILKECNIFLNTFNEFESEITNCTRGSHTFFPADIALCQKDSKESGVSGLSVGARDCCESEKENSVQRSDSFNIFEMEDDPFSDDFFKTKEF